MKWEGSLQNRLLENQEFNGEITVGTGATEYLWSDRHPYEVIEVKDQKHVYIRRLDAKPTLNSEPMSNDWELYSNEDNAIIYLTKRGKYWYNTKVITKDQLKDDSEFRLWLAMNSFNEQEIKEKGKQTRYTKMNISFGQAEYYYDYSF